MNVKFARENVVLIALDNIHFDYIPFVFSYLYIEFIIKFILRHTDYQDSRYNALILF